MDGKFSPKRVLLLLISLLILFLLIFNQDSIFNFYQKTSYFIKSFSDRSFDYKRFSDIQKENQRLEFELSNIKENPSLSKDFETKRALVYSRYPFSGRDRFIINLGEKEGIKKDMPVLKNNFLLGRVVYVSNHQSEVQTIFDPEWKSSVGVGDYSKKAVLEGGSTPVVNLIPKDSDVQVGDEIFNLSSDYPLYELIGSIESIESKVGDLWNTAKVKTPYKISDIKEVDILIDFP